MVALASSKYPHSEIREIVVVPEVRIEAAHDTAIASLPTAPTRDESARATPQPQPQPQPQHDRAPLSLEIVR